MTNHQLETRLMRHFAYQKPGTRLNVSNLKRSMRRSLEQMHPMFHEREVIDAMHLLEVLGVAERLPDRGVWWVAK